MFAAFCQVAGEPPRDLRWALCAGAPLARSIAERAEQRLGACVRQGYGMTEATFVAINAPPDERVFDSVGKPAWGIELRVVDGSGADVPAGESGEVLVRGHNVMTHYLFDDSSTQVVVRDGWVHSGDVGQLDAQGRLQIVDRIKDLIIRGGYNVYPSELESVLAAHPDVREVSVIGRPDPFYGEEIVAVVVPNRSPLMAAELDAFAAQRLSRSKLPREYAFVEALPLGPSGKVQKRSLRDQLAEGRLTIERV
jgi:long-chain acyl-CoA synthetase